jgi:hypothetical protein
MKYFMALLIKRGSQGLVNYTVESAKRAMKSSISILVAGIILSGIVLYSLIQLFKQFEIYILQNYEYAETILTAIYGVVVAGGLVGLYLIFKGQRRPEEVLPVARVQHEPIEAAITGFINGFVTGMKRGA